jgi:hypothetical protein
VAGRVDSRARQEAMDSNLVSAAVSSKQREQEISVSPERFQALY